MTWIWEEFDDGQKYHIFGPDGQEETVDNVRGVVNGTPPDVKDVVAEHDLLAAIKDDIQPAQP